VLVVTVPVAEPDLNGIIGSKLITAVAHVGFP
jgi:hypothetical protein